MDQRPDTVAPLMTMYAIGMSNAGQPTREAHLATEGEPEHRRHVSREHEENGGAGATVGCRVPAWWHSSRSGRRGSSPVHGSTAEAQRVSPFPASGARADAYAHGR